MTHRFTIKAAAILIGIVILLVFNIALLQGAFFADRIGVFPERARLAADSNTNYTMSQNVRVKSFDIQSKSKDTVFRKGALIEVFCTIMNIGDETLENFKSVVRTPKKEIASLESKSLAPNESARFHGSWTPEETGFTPVACRADIDNQISESNENDNRALSTIYVVE